MEKALLISIGNELLSGKTINTNATFLAKKLTKLGFLIHKILTIPDDQNIVSEEISQAISGDKFRLILITGGLGPTWDDSTSSFLAKALNTDLELNPEALSIVTRRYADLYKEKLVSTAEITPSREKMAFLPINAEPIDNPVGTAPGILYNHKSSNTWIVCFPGVPREMKEMYHLIEPKIISLINDENANYHEIEFYTPFTDESLIAPLLDKVRQKHDVWIKSLPETYQEEKKIHIVISKASDSVNAKEEVLAAKSYLQNLINSSQTSNDIN
jgi:molybdenum cofactor synthesis domain-containing protein